MFCLGPPEQFLSISVIVGKFSVNHSLVIAFPAAVFKYLSGFLSTVGRFPKHMTLKSKLIYGQIDDLSVSTSSQSEQTKEWS